jgi:2,5-diketo-D-gluconate reductase A
MAEIFNVLHETINTKDGLCIPALLFGTKGIVVKDMELILNNGFFALDMASVYNTDEIVFHTIKSFITSAKSKLDRDKFYFVYKIDATKVLPEEIEHKLDNLLNLIAQTFTEAPPFIDMLVIHSPNHNVPIDRTWTYMQQLKAFKKVKSIGVSNFNLDHLKCMIALNLEMPAINQVETNPFFAQNGLAAYCIEHGIKISSFRSIRNKATNDDLNILTAIAAELNLTPIQVIHSWKYTRGYQIVTTSKNLEHMHELKYVVKLEDIYMQRLAVFDKGIFGRTCQGSWSCFDFNANRWDAYVPEQS